MFPIGQVMQALLPGPAGQLIGSILQSAINRGQSVSVFSTPWGGVSYNVVGPGGYGGYGQAGYGASGGGFTMFPTCLMPFARPVAIPGLGIGYFFGTGGGPSIYQTGNPYATGATGATQSQPATISGPDTPSTSVSPSTVSSSGGSASASSGAFEDNLLASAGKADSLMKEAESLMNSGDQKDMMKAQMLMQKATQLITMMSNILEARHKAMMSMINNIREA